MKKRVESICVFGDSISWGAWDLERGGWVNRLWFYVAKRSGDDYVEVYNQSISGGTTETILSRFEAEASIRNGDALIFQTGGNDAARQGVAGDFLVDPETFRSNVEKIIHRAKKLTERIVFMELRNCDESKTTPVPWADIFYTNENIQKYIGIMKEVCEKNGVHFLNLESLEDGDFNDGLHPNAAGHEKIFRHVKNSLIDFGWI